MVRRYLQKMLDRNLTHITKDRDEDEHVVNVIVPHFNILEVVVIAYNNQKYIIYPLVIRLTGPTPYESDRVKQRILQRVCPKVERVSRSR